MTTKAKLGMIQTAIYSVGDTLTAAEALSLIGSLFHRDPIVRINPGQLAELKAAIDPPKRRVARKAIR
jgi:hypothetical protein